jgi:isoleucyl-tRNA synthetase
MLFGDASTTKMWAHDHRIELHGPGYSKVILGDDAADQWEKYIDLMAASIAANGGRSCINASGVWTPKNADKIADALARMLAPILVFTSDEIWENLPRSADDEAEQSVHVALLPEPAEISGADLLTSWAHLFGYRDAVLAKLEDARVAKVIGSSLEARVEISAGAEAYGQLARHRDDLRYLFIVSEVELGEPHAEMAPDDIEVTIARAHGDKCERCWNYSTRVGESSKFPTVCERCVAAFEEIEAN